MESAEDSDKDNKKVIRPLKEVENLELRQDFTPQPLHFTDYEESVVVGEQPLTGSRLLPVYTLDWTSSPNSYFMPVTGLDFLIGVPEVLLLQTAEDLKGSDFKFLVKIPKGETLYMGMENSSSFQKAFFCSQRSFNMTLLDPTKHEAATFTRRGALTNIRTCFRQELVISANENKSFIGRIIQNNILPNVSFTIYDEKNEVVYKIIGSQKSYCGWLSQDIHFSILDPENRTGGVILHKWDNDFKAFLYHITFPSCNAQLHHKMLLIGSALLVEYTYFKKTGCFCFS